MGNDCLKMGIRFLSDKTSPTRDEITGGKSRNPAYKESCRFSKNL